MLFDRASLFFRWLDLIVKSLYRNKCLQAQRIKLYLLYVSVSERLWRQIFNSLSISKTLMEKYKNKEKNKNRNPHQLHWSRNNQSILIMMS